MLSCGLLQDLAYSSDRCEMVRQALGSSNWIRLSEWESRQDQWTRTRLVLQHHQVTQIIFVLKFLLSEGIEFILSLRCRCVPVYMLSSIKTID